MFLSSVFLLFLRMGAFTFGGGIVMLGFIEKELRSTGRISADEISGMMVLATAFPGPVAVNMALLAGKRLAGAWGAFVAVIGTSLPPFLTILLLSKVLLRFMHEPWLSAFFRGATCAVVVIIGQVVYGMTKISFGRGWKDVLAFTVVVFLLMGFQLHPFIALGSGLFLRLALGEGEVA
jgi:chromate transporter